MGLRSGEFPGHGPKISTFWSPSHLVITFALWHGAPSCWKMHCSSPNCCWVVGRSCCWRVFWYHSLFMAVWGKVIFSDEAPFQLFGASGKKGLSGEEKGERYHQSCVMPTVKHPDTIHVWGCFSSKGVGSLTILPKNTAMNKEWYQNTLQQQLLPTTQQQFGEEQCIFQHDGAPCHKAKVITKWLGDQNVEILGPWPGNSPDLNPIKNLWSILKRRVDKQKPTNSDKLQEVIMKEWVAISQDLAQKLIESMPSQIAEVLKKKGQHCKY
uniref:Tc1-like transposase DDE domain-containing protein n=1 Tax=Cyprinus carpio carpio TaxID=630221 RepID=A0A9J7ZTN8_CYPCA